MKKVLHISSDFLNTNLYNLMFNALSSGTKNQLVFSAVKKFVEIGDKKSDKYESLSSPILGFIDKFFYKKRILKTYEELSSKVDVSAFDLVHAHFLFTDGGLALKIKREKNLPYIVAVRNTDINLYFKYQLHLRSTAFDILDNAEKIVLITPRYKAKLFSFFSAEQVNKIKDKVVIIPNGINNLWHNPIPKPKPKPKGKALKFLFIGEISKNKNIPYVIGLLKSLTNYYSVKFTIIGREEDGLEKVRKLAKKYDWIEYLGEVKDKSVLKNHYREADIFIMLSRLETFGLVYIEAMSQGTPIIYSKGQGVDGYFQEGKVGYNCDCVHKSFFSFKESVDKIFNQYEQLSEHSILESSKFNWGDIVERYITIYREM